VQGLDLSFAGSVTDSKFDSSVLTADDPLTTANEAQPIAGIRDGNRLPTVPRYQFAASATYGQPIGDRANWFATASVQRVGNRYTQPGDQEPGVARIGNALYYDPATKLYGQNVNDAGSFRLPAYTLTNLSAGIDFDSGLGVQFYVNNLFDRIPLLSLDRERNARARIGFNVAQPRTIGVTVRQKIGR
jgi:outer membrane receptor protein involved in Fe transport